MPTYPAGVHSHFLDFPLSIRMVTGQLLAEDSGLFDYGDSVVLRKTPQSGVLQGDLVVGEELPTKRMIYTDTGEDDSFNLKIAYEGWGEFAVRQSGDETYTLFITRGTSLQAGDWDEEKVFRQTVELVTRIPTTTDLAGVEPPSTVSLDIEYAEETQEFVPRWGSDEDPELGDDYDYIDPQRTPGEYVQPVYDEDRNVSGWMEIRNNEDGSQNIEYVEGDGSGSLSLN